MFAKFLIVFITLLNVFQVFCGSYNDYSSLEPKEYNQLNNLALNNTQENIHQLLFNACQIGDEHAVESVLNKNFFINITETLDTSNNTSCLFEAATNGHLNIVKMLLNYAYKNRLPFNLNEHYKISESKAASILSECINNAQEEVIALILNFAKKNNIPLNLNNNKEDSENENSIIVHAALLDQSKVVELLLTHGADPDIPSPLLNNRTLLDNNNRTIFELIVEYTNTPVTSLLVSNSITDASQGKYNSKELMRVFISGRSSIGYIKEIKNLIQTQSESKDLSQIKYMLNSKTSSGRTPLMWAAIKSNQEDIKKFLSLKSKDNCYLVDATLSDNKGDTALSLALKHKRKEISLMLYKYLLPQRISQHNLLEKLFSKYIPHEINEYIAEFILGRRPNT